MTGGATFFSNEVTLGRDEGSLGTALLEGAGSRWDITGSFDVGRDGAALVSVQNEAVLCLLDNVIWNIGSQGAFSGDGTISLLTENCPDLIQGDGEALRSGGIQVYASTLFLSAGSTIEAEGIVLGEGGTLGGDGTLDLPITNAGSLAPGGPDSTGVFTLANAYTQANEGTLAIEFGGGAPGEGYDRLAVTGDATLSGTLRLVRLEGYTPMAGETYTLLTASSVTGAFDAIEEPDGVEFDVSYTATEVVAEVTAVTVANEDAPGPELPRAFALHAAYPNPFATRTTLRYDVLEAGRAQLAVYDVLGREVVVLVDGPVPTGAHEAVFEASGLASGLYLVRLSAEGGFSKSKVITLLR